MGFYFWLDVVATVSMLFDIPVVMDAMFGGGSGGGAGESTTLLKAGRASRAGTRAGRIVRLVRLIRILKLYKQMAQRAQEKEDGLQLQVEEDEEEEGEQSRVGQKLSDLTTRRVIVGVLAMLFILPLFDLHGGYYDAAPTPDFMGLQMLMYAYDADGGAASDGFQSSLKSYVESTVMSKADKQTHFIYQLDVCGETIINETPDPAELRDEEALTFRFAEEGVCDKKISLTRINTRWESQLQAILNMLRTVFICIVLGLGAMLFSKDANDLVLYPIERMVKRVQDMAENPLAKRTVKKEADDKDGNQMETKILEYAFEKVCSLLAVGFGDAGAEIIGSNMASGGDLDPMVTGKKMCAIFGFCDIRQFTDTTEVLEEGIMEFVNNIARIVHAEVALHGGSANKNIGDAFLLVWKFPKDVGLDDVLNLHRCPPKKRDAIAKVGDSALASFVVIMSALKRSQRLWKYGQNAALNERIPNFSVRMGFGLHVGWAIEGAIGSEYKIDASYLSPNVNMASRLEAATKQFGSPILLSEQFVELLSPHVREKVREIDTVTVKGSNKPTSLFTYDVDLTTVPDPTDGGDEDDEYLTHSTQEYTEEFNQNPDIVGSRAVGPEFLKTFGEGFKAYKDGEWGKAKEILQGCISSRVDSTGAHMGDGPSETLMRVMEEYNFNAPSNWRGFRELTDK